MNKREQVERDAWECLRATHKTPTQTIHELKVAGFTLCGPDEVPMPKACLPSCARVATCIDSAELAALRRDAERYRVARIGIRNISRTIGIYNVEEFEDEWLRGLNADAAIDAALAAQSKEKGE